MSLAEVTNNLFNKLIFKLMWQKTQHKLFKLESLLKWLSILPFESTNQPKPFNQRRFCDFPDNNNTFFFFLSCFWWEFFSLKFLHEFVTLHAKEFIFDKFRSHFGRCERTTADLGGSPGRRFWADDSTLVRPHPPWRRRGGERVWK